MFLLVLFGVMTGAYVQCFNITYFRIPEEVPPGQTEVDFECKYNGNFTVMSWFKGPNEFFKYKPGAAPTIRSFPIAGIGRIQVEHCGPEACLIHLGGLTEEASGFYSCDIERAIVPYKFARKRGYMLVHAREKRRPFLEGLAPEFSEGDEMMAYCRAENNTEVRWYINKQEIFEMRGSHSFKHQSSRAMFLDSPPKVTIQCAASLNGTLLGSKEVIAYWTEPIQTNADETAQAQKNQANNDTLLSYLLVVSVKFLVNDFI